MKSLLRRIRGAIGLGATFGAAWFAAGVGLLLVVGPDAADVPFPVGFGALGFLAGVSFSVVLGLVEGRRRFDQMSLPRFAAWGALGGLILAGLFAGAVGLIDGTRLPLLVLGPVFAAAGAVSAAGTLALARSGEDPLLVAQRGEADAVGLTPEESKDLLGRRS